MTEAGCPLCAEALTRLDVTIAMVEQAARGAYAARVPELTAAVADACHVLLGFEIEVLEPYAAGAPRFTAALDQAKAAAAEAIRHGCPCAVT